MHMTHPHPLDAAERDDSSRLLPIVDTPDQRVLDDSWFDLPALDGAGSSVAEPDDVDLDDPWFR